MTIPQYPPARMSATERERKRRIGYFLGKVGVAWVLTTIALDVVLHVLARPELPRHLMYASLTAGAVVGWWGFFWAEPKRAKDGGTWVLDARERFHAHRRATDPAPASEGVAAPAAPAPGVAPDPDQDAP